jgi:hypothetical protein
MNYVFIPFADEKFDPFAAALVKEKNAANKFIGRHELIKRADQGNSSATPLSVIGRFDRLYVGVHGTEKLAGVGGYHTYEMGTGKSRDQILRTHNHTIRGEELADLLVKLGLPNKYIDLRLWTCWGGGKAQEDRDGVEVGDGDRMSFVTRVAAGLRGLGWNWITVVGYTHLVDLRVDKLRERQGHKELQRVFGEDTYMPTKGHKVTVPIKII